MTYTSSTFGASANPAQDFMAVLDPLIRAGGFTFVETFTSSTDVTNVYRSPVASNGVQDWYLYMRRTLPTSTSVIFTVSEAWDATGKKMQKYVYGNQNTLAPNSAANYTITDATGQTPAGGTYSNQSLGTGTGGHQYWLSVNPSRLIIGTRVGTTDWGLYAGMLDEIIPNTVPGTGLQLAVGYLINTSLTTPNWYFTREPGQTVTNVGNFGGVPYNVVYMWGWFGQGVVDVYTGKPYACRTVVTSCRGVNGSPRGLPKDVLVTTFPSSAVNGDTITLGAKTYTRMGAGAGSNANFYVDQAT